MSVTLDGRLKAILIAKSLHTAAHDAAAIAIRYPIENNRHKTPLSASCLASAMTLKSKESNESKESVSSTGTFVPPAEAASWLDTTLHAGNLILTTLTQAASASPDPFLKAASGTALVILSTVQVRIIECSESALPYTVA